MWCAALAEPPPGGGVGARPQAPHAGGRHPPGAGVGARPGRGTPPHPHRRGHTPGGRHTPKGHTHPKPPKGHTPAQPHPRRSPHRDPATTTGGTPQGRTYPARPNPPRGTFSVRSRQPASGPRCAPRRRRRCAPVHALRAHPTGARRSGCQLASQAGSRCGVGGWRRRGARVWGGVTSAPGRSRPGVHRVFEVGRSRAHAPRSSSPLAGGVSAVPSHPWASALPAGFPSPGRGTVLAPQGIRHQRPGRRVGCGAWWVGAGGVRRGVWAWSVAGVGVEDAEFRAEQCPAEAGRGRGGRWVSCSSSRHAGQSPGGGRAGVPCSWRHGPHSDRATAAAGRPGGRVGRILAHREAAGATVAPDRPRGGLHAGPAPQ